MQEVLSTLPIREEILLNTENKYSFLQPVPGVNEIVLCEDIIKKLFKSIPIIKIILPGEDLLPLGCLTYPLRGSGPRWHRDKGYPIVGIYKPFGISRKAGTLFTIIENLTVFNQGGLRDRECYRNDYSDPKVSSLTLFSNVQFPDGRYMIHRRETFQQNEMLTMALDARKTFFVKVKNIENDLEGDE